MEKTHDRRFLGALGFLGFLGALGFLGSDSHRHLAHFAWLAYLALPALLVLLQHVVVVGDEDLVVREVVPELDSDLIRGDVIVPAHHMEDLGLDILECGQ